MDKPLTRRILDLLASRQIAHRVLRHSPVRTSEEAARVRGTPLGAGAKALVCHADDELILIVVPANRRFDGRAFRRQTRIRSIRMIDPDQVEELVGAPVGAVPPFGSLMGLPTFADRAIVAQPEIAFNAGARDVSVVMSGADYGFLELPILGDFAGVETRPHLEAAP